MFVVFGERRGAHFMVVRVVLAVPVRASRARPTIEGKASVKAPRTVGMGRW